MTETETAKPTQPETTVVTPHYSKEQKTDLIARHIQKLKNGVIEPEFVLKKIHTDEPEIIQFKKYLDRYNAGELTKEELEIYDGDWLSALKAKDKKLRSDVITGDGWQGRRNAIATIHNRPRTDLGNSERLIDQFGSLIRYCHPMKSWYIWNYPEGRWKLDDNGYIYRMGKDVIRRIYYEASHAPTTDAQKALTGWALMCECKTHLSGMIELAQTEKTILVSPDDFDKNDMLFNLRNGTYNLRTHVKQDHDKSNTLSKLADFEYDPKATCPIFDKYLDRIFRSNKNKEDIINFLQRAIGYTLTGDTSEECLFAPYGSGANGKSVLLEIMHSLFGEYGSTINSRSFTTERGGQTNDIAALPGKRFVSSSENSSDSHLDEELIKRLTGKDLVSARFLHKEFFEFRPKFKLWWAFNHPPVITDMTNSIWRRMNILPFTERIPDEEMDKQLADKIIKNELPGVFNWAVEGLKEYQKIGLNKPETVTKATKEYKNDQDILLDFFNANYEFTESDKDVVQASMLYSDYKSWWLNIESSKPLSSTKFGRLCRDRGLTKHEERKGTVVATFYQKIRSIHQQTFQKR
jgi:putative DNA primase/helicase